MKKKIVPLMLAAALMLSTVPVSQATGVPGETTVSGTIAANAKVVTYNVTVPTAYAFVVNAKFDDAADNKVINTILEPGTIAGEDGSVQIIDAPQFLNASYIAEGSAITGTEVMVTGTLEAKNVSGEKTPTAYNSNLWRPVPATAEYADDAVVNGDAKTSPFFQYGLYAGGQGFDTLVAENVAVGGGSFTTIKIKQSKGFLLAAPTEKNGDKYVGVATPANFNVKVAGLKDAAGVNDLTYWKLLLGGSPTEADASIKSAPSAEIASISWDVTMPTTVP